MGDVLRKEVPPLIETLNVTRMVEEKVNQLDILQVEDLLMGVMKEQFKYINSFECQENKAGPVLFDLKEHPDESRNVAADHPETVGSMQGIADRWLQKTQPVRPPYFYSDKK